MKRLPTIEEWAIALESGEFKQGREGLHNLNGESCCLGVACILAEVPKTDELSDGRFVDFDFSEVEGSEFIYWAYPSHKFMQAYGMDQRGRPESTFTIPSLADMNDQGCSFQEIAKTLREWRDNNWIHDPIYDAQLGQ